MVCQHILRDPADDKKKRKSHIFLLVSLGKSRRKEISNESIILEKKAWKITEKSEIHARDDTLQLCKSVILRYFIVDV